MTHSIHFPKHLASHIEKDVASSAKFVVHNVGSAGKYVIDSGIKAETIAVDGTKSIFSSMTIPLVIGGVVVLIFVMNR